MTAFAGRLRAAVGWRRWLFAFLFGASAVAAQPPFHVLPALLVAFPGLIWLLDGAASPRSAFGVGWMFGAGYFAAGLYWVPNALLVDAARFAWLIPFAVLGLSLGLGLFIGGVTLLARQVWSSGAGRVFGLAASWALFEWVRGTVLTGFPWNPVGNVWVAAPPVLQSAAWLGVYGLSAITVFAAAALAMFGTSGPRRWYWGISGIALIALIAVAGTFRLADATRDTVPGVFLRIVQPNIAQRDKWLPARRAQNYARHLQMSGERGDGRITHVIWPETAAPFSVSTDAARRALMRRAVPPKGLLLTGSVRLERQNGRVVRVWNSLVAVDEKADVVAVYDKHHLVPFGEYMPLREILPLDKITGGALDFSRGPGPRTLRLPGLPAFSPLICYEVIFPGRVVDSADRPSWLLNITNDAWFGTSAGPHQHFASARLRAVEEGLPVVRAANTGISAVVDAYGRVVSSLGLGQAGIVDSKLPVAAPDRTLFARFGNIIPGFMILLMFFAAVVFRVRQRSENK
ncbi:MAG: apolipoprotein N-acyltransferase [Paracoccaceae bacterium]|jgi:apolipoprotein N-acyltransferase